MRVFETDRDAVAVGMLLWEWLAEDPAREKCEWPGWKRNGGGIKDCVQDCPACQGLQEEGAESNSPCSKCLVWTGRTSCLGHGPTSYMHWKNKGRGRSTEEVLTERSAIAASIAGLHRRALKRIVEGG